MMSAYSGFPCGAASGAFLPLLGLFTIVGFVFSTVCSEMCLGSAVPGVCSWSLSAGWALGQKCWAQAFSACSWLKPPESRHRQLPALHGPRVFLLGWGLLCEAPGS